MWQGLWPLAKWLGVRYRFEKLSEKCWFWCSGIHVKNDPARYIPLIFWVTATIPATASSNPWHPIPIIFTLCFAHWGLGRSLHWSVISIIFMMTQFNTHWSMLTIGGRSQSTSIPWTSRIASSTWFTLFIFTTRPTVLVMLSWWKDTFLSRKAGWFDSE